MNTKVLAFVSVSVILVGAIYSPFAYFVFAEVIYICDPDRSKTTRLCGTWDSETNEFGGVKCTVRDDGKTWDCEKVKMETGASISPGLKDALDITIGESQKTPKVPKTDLLNDNEVMTQGDTADTGNDTNVPKDFGGINNDLPAIGPDD
ncbi:MAG TPA: hypothetical protein VJ772_06435 [Nitrososphaeraceae archaeon]|nr:hypothetical protein [Nitrososphaeraceae archaeon]